MDFERARTALAAAYREFTAAVSETDPLRPTRCAGWAGVDLLFHVLCDAQRALVAFATPADGPPDVDHVTYWSSFQPVPDAPEGAGGGADAHAWWVRRSASAFTRPSGVLRVWQDTAPAAVRAALAADPAGHVATQGHVIAVPDFLATLATEAAVHHLDLQAARPPAREALELAGETLDGLLGADRPAHLDLTTYVLEATGRLPSADDRFPLLS
ncbi:maleylpyruvate isomerase N-terminal domain-containing protein [Nonomuraea sp. NPDC050227]|uniref:maleylpyruvate isomerase N-terminal domain-containing protein n=1 Tax=Nonomuraea sp. NPDC050227 TaxID=3364360 RepID=UPI00379A4F44